MDDLKAHPEDTATLQMVTGFLSKAVNEDSTLPPLVLQLAQRIKNDSLFRAAVHAGFRNGEPAPGTIPALVGIVKNAPAGPVDWQKRCVERQSARN
jgi:hypothetical protein